MDDREELNERIAALEARNRQLLRGAEIGKDLFEKSKSLIAQIEQLERENRTLADQVAVFKSRQESFNEEREEANLKLTRMTEELEQSRAEVRSLTVSLRSANQSIESLRSISKEYERSLNDTQQMQQQLSQLRSENTKLKSTKTKTEQAAIAQSAAIDMEEMKDLKQKTAELAGLSSAHRALQQKLEQLQRDNESYQQELAEKENIVKVVNSLVKANKHFQQQQEEYQSLLKQANDTIATLKREAEQQKIEAANRFSALSPRAQGATTMTNITGPSAWIREEEADHHNDEDAEDSLLSLAEELVEMDDEQFIQEHPDQPEESTERTGFSARDIHQQLTLAGVLETPIATRPKVETRDSAAQTDPLQLEPPRALEVDPTSENDKATTVAAAPIITPPKPRAGTIRLTEHRSQQSLLSELAEGELHLATDEQTEIVSRSSTDMEAALESGESLQEAVEHELVEGQLTQEATTTHEEESHSEIAEPAVGIEVGIEETVVEQEAHLEAPLHVEPEQVVVESHVETTQELAEPELEQQASVQERESVEHAPVELELALEQQQHTSTEEEVSLEAEVALEMQQEQTHLTQEDTRQQLADVELAIDESATTTDEIAAPTVAAAPLDDSERQSLQAQVAQLRTELEELGREKAQLDQERENLMRQQNKLQQQLRRRAETWEKERAAIEQTYSELSVTRLREIELRLVAEQERARVLQAKLDADREKQAHVFLQVIDIRQRLTDAHETIMSPKMRNVLETDEMIMISKTVIESAIADTKKLLEEEGILKLQGKSREWVCQLYEVLLKNGELYLKHIKLVQKMQALKKLQAQERRDETLRAPGSRVSARARSGSQSREMQQFAEDSDQPKKGGFWSIFQRK